jgi:hypothetical protein
MTSAMPRRRRSFIGRRVTRRRLGPVLLLLALAFLPRPARANMAAPSFRSGTPLSASLAPPSAAGLSVRAETLTFDVGAEGAAVVAEYRVEAAADAELALTFLSPERSSGLRAWVNDQERPVTTAPLEGVTEDDRRYAATLGPFKALHRSAFTGRLQAGENRLRVTYTQGFGLYWIPYGYFKDPAYLRVFPYELWPLKGWALAPDFELEVKVALVTPRAGVWSRLFGQVPSWRLHLVGCSRALAVQDAFGRRFGLASDGGEGDRAGGLVPLVAPVEAQLLGGAISVGATLGSAFPDRLFVVVDKAGDRGTE